MHNAFVEIHHFAACQLLSELSVVRALMVVDTTQPGNEQVLLVEVAQLVVKVILVQALDQQEVGQRYRQILCAQPYLCH